MEAENVGREESGDYSVAHNQTFKTSFSLATTE